MDIPVIRSKEQIDKILRCQCVNCGGHLETPDRINYKCRYCDTKYTVKQTCNIYEPPQYIIEVVHPDMIVCGVWEFISDEHKQIYGDHTDLMIKKRIMSHLAEYIEEHFDELVDIEEEKDYDKDYGKWLSGTTYRATMRMLHNIGERNGTI